MKNLIVVAALVLTTFSFNHARAQGSEGFEIDLGFMSLGDSLDSNGSASGSSHNLFTLAFGYKFAGPIFVGLQFDNDVKAQVSGGATTRSSFSSYGPMLGLQAE